MNPCFAAFLLLTFPFNLLTGAATPAERQILAANQGVDRNPNFAQSYNDLAAALCERAAETGDISYFQLAEKTILHSFQLSPDDYSAQKIRVTILLGLHRWSEALQAAKDLNHRVPDDLAVWGLLADANVMLGNYMDAEKAAQWMFDLRPRNNAAFLPAAKLREASGDLEGALDFLDEAFRRTPEEELVARAFLLTESARLQILNGNPNRAMDLVNQALQLYPGYHHALLVSATLHRGEAVALLSRRYEQAKTTSALYDWVMALLRAGRTREAAKEFQSFESRAQSEIRQPYNANLQLVFYYADQKSEPVKALMVAEQEMSVRHDAATLDAYAWALFRNRKVAQAKSRSSEALATGTRDPQILLHSRQIAAASR